MIISHLDDIVVRRGLGQAWQFVQKTIFKSFRTKTILEGTAEFHHGLLKGFQNPLYYITRSSWKMNAFFKHLFDQEKMPAGTYFMKGGPLMRELRKKDPASKDKYLTIRFLLDYHPHLNCILIGASGRRDPETFTKILNENPHRVDAIYLRDLTDGLLDSRVRALKAACEIHGVPIVLINDMDEAAQHARVNHFISYLSTLTPDGEYEPATGSTVLSDRVTNTYDSPKTDDYRPLISS